MGDIINVGLGCFAVGFSCGALGLLVMMRTAVHRQEERKRKQQQREWRPVVNKTEWNVDVPL